MPTISQRSRATLKGSTADPMQIYTYSQHGQVSNETDLRVSSSAGTMALLVGTMVWLVVVAIPCRADGLVTGTTSTPPPSYDYDMSRYGTWNGAPATGPCSSLTFQPSSWNIGGWTLVGPSGFLTIGSDKANWGLRIDTGMGTGIDGAMYCYNGQWVRLNLASCNGGPVAGITGATSPASPYCAPTLNCPANSARSGSTCICNDGYAPNGVLATACKPRIDRDGGGKPPQACPKTPKPIYINTGVERYTIELGVAVGWERLVLTYDTTRRAPTAVPGIDKVDSDPPSFGELWRSSLHKKITIGAAYKGARVSRGDGSAVSFSGDGAGNYTPDADTNDRLITVSGGYRFTDAGAKTQESYNGQGQLTRIDRSDGQFITFTYSTSSTPASVAPAPGYLLIAQDHFGRTVAFEYELPAGAIAATGGRVKKMTDPQGRLITPAYAGANLTELTWPDNQIRRFHYEHATHAWAMTGVTDENNVRHATIGYDSVGRAISSALADGVDAYSISYATAPVIVISDTYDATSDVVLRTRIWQAPGSPSVTRPNGSSSTYAAAVTHGIPRMTSQSQPAGSGCASSTSALSYDANGNVARKDDFNGTRSCYANDLSRNLEITRVEGLANTTTCSSVTPAGATLPTNARKTTTQWHPDWRLETKRAEPKKTTTHVYNGQPDPFNGNAIATCAPSTALLPDGKPIAVLCKTVEQATTDANGNQGIAGLVGPAGPDVALMLHMNGANGSTTFTDTSLSPKTVAVSGAAQVTTSGPKFGSGALALNGINSYLSVGGAADWTFLHNGSPWTIEGWVALNSFNAPHTLLDTANGTTASSGIYLGVLTNRQVNLQIFRSVSGTHVLNGSFSGLFPNDTNYHHLAITWDLSQASGNAQLYIDGQFAGQLNKTANAPSSSAPATSLSIGKFGNALQIANGKVDDLRITRDAVLYSAAFSPPSQEFGDPSAQPSVYAGPSLQAGTPERTQSYTYNQYGRVLSSTDARGNITSYAYYSDTSFSGADPNAVGHTVGDLQSVTNPAGHVTQYTLYDKNGRLLQSIEPNGATTDNQYSPRGWLTQVSVTPAGGGSALITSYGYDAAGQLTSVTYPGQGPISYSYDAAHRLTGISDAAGNSVSYLLDNAGNRISENTKDPSGALAKTITRAFDALNRVQSATGGTQ